VEPDGGVARRATLIRDFRKQMKTVLVLEAGSSLASGPDDGNAQSEDLDKKRSGIYLEALKLMNYDAVLVDGQAFAFGEKFIEPYRASLPFVSANISGAAAPFVIREFGGLRVGIIGITEASAVKKGARDWREPAAVLRQLIAELKKKDVGIVILLSAQTPQEDEKMLKDLKGIDIVINGSKNFGSVAPREVGGTVYLQTWWQAKKVGVLNLKISDGKITRMDVSVPPLVSGIPDDGAVALLLPQCFRTQDCRRMQGLSGSCQNGGSKEARCTYVALPRVTLTAINPSDCLTCRKDAVIADLADMWGEMNVISLDEKDPAAQKLIKDFNIMMLPAYIFHKDAEESAVFETFRSNLEEKNGYYRIKPAIAGVSYIIGRQRTSRTIDVFYDYRYPALRSLFELLSAFTQKHPDFQINWHFLAIFDREKGFVNLGAAADIEEFKRVACVQKLYPKRILDYLICRTGQVDAGWWDECAKQAGIDSRRIKACALSEEGASLLKESIRLTEELEMASGPTFVIDNVEIFGIVNVPSLKEFEETVMRKDVPERNTAAGRKK
jgi:5'-nucleotidase